MTGKDMFKMKMIILFVMIALFAIACLLTKEEKTIQGDNVQKVELYKNYPYTKYYVIADGKKYEVNRTAYRNIK